MTLSTLRSAPARFFHWLGTPLRVLSGAIAWLVDLTPRQMQSLCTLAMIGGIIANSFWTWLYVDKAERAAYMGLAIDSPLFHLIYSTVKYLAFMSGGFALFMCLIAFGAEWLKINYKDFDLGVGKDAKEAANEVADAAADKAEQIGAAPTAPEHPGGG